MKRQIKVEKKISKIEGARNHYHCLRCGWSWYSKLESIVVCASCNSPYWDKEKEG